MKVSTGRKPRPSVRVSVMCLVWSSCLFALIFKRGIIGMAKRHHTHQMAGIDMGVAAQCGTPTEDIIERCQCRKRED